MNESEKILRKIKKMKKQANSSHGSGMPYYVIGAIETLDEFERYIKYLKKQQGKKVEGLRNE